MQSRRFQDGLGLAVRRAHHDLALQVAQCVARAHRRWLRESKIDNLPVAGERAPQPGVAVVGVDYRGAPGLQALEDLALGAGNGLDRAEEFQVRRPGVGDERDVRCGEPREVSDLAGMVHAHLHHRKAMPGPELEERQRHADIVVEVAARGEHGVLGARGAQDARQHLLDRRLAVAARQRDERRGKLPAPAGRQPAEREPGVIRHQRRQPRRQLGCVVHQGTRDLLARRLGKKIVPVEMLALERDEQCARGKRAGVGAHRVEVAVLSPQFRRDRARGLRQAHQAHPESASRATAASENGNRTPRISW